ncbi:hypothetical protein KVR01_006047 [Diaporthe batatas]|uniref:uncharacterized protein n=1 Tax=Diaporthe batatas TaxID=748121 RepID=UPI001D0511A3|nr:uncharacterized protein KVR01_006047 [Diaporthe batatas]KAG8164129.1 hypothetical protein KVR01_006047 [Diaporthe batatas]
MELQCCFALWYHIAVGFTFVYYVMPEDEIPESWVVRGLLTTHGVANCAICSDCQDLSTLPSRQGLFQDPVRRATVPRGSPGIEQLACSKSFIQRNVKEFESRFRKQDDIHLMLLFLLVSALA